MNLYSKRHQISVKMDLLKVKLWNKTQGKEIEKDEEENMRVKDLELELEL